MELSPRSAAAVAAAAGIAIASMPLPASAAQGSRVTVTQLAGGLVSPLGLAIGSDGTAYVSQTFAGKVTAIGKKGTRDLVTVPGTASGVAVGRGALTFTSSEGPEGSQATRLRRMRSDGQVTTLADTGAYERRANPDRVNTYGFLGLSAACAAQLPPGFPRTYTGIVESNPYKILPTRAGSWIVADAAANDLLRVSRSGRISTLAVLPPAPPVTLDAAAAQARGLPACTVGARFRFEAVPTDIERGPDGYLYVSSLPGGFDIASLGARGAVYRVNPFTGRARLIAYGFAGATDLAVSPNGTIYVTEMLGNRISVVRHGRPRPLVTLTAPVAVEWSRGALYATTNPNSGPGTLVKITL